MNKKRELRGDEHRNLSSLNKKGQVTIFIVIAILIVAVILLFYFYVGPNFVYSSARKPALEKCIENAIYPKLQDLSLTAGVVSPSFTSMYLDENYTFICYTNEYYSPCVVQYPFLIDTFEESLSKYMAPKIQDCYDVALDDLRSRGNDIVSGKIKSELKITPDGIEINIDAPTVISSGDASASFRTFKVKTYSNIYTILMLANTILQFETSFGDSDVSSFMFFYPEISVEKIRREDGIKLYILTDKKDIKYRFATRSYAWPPGYGNTFN